MNWFLVLNFMKINIINIFDISNKNELNKKINKNILDSDNAVSMMNNNSKYFFYY